MNDEAGGIGDGSNMEYILEVNIYKQKTSGLTCKESEKVVRMHKNREKN